MIFKKYSRRADQRHVTVAIDVCGNGTHRGVIARDQFLNKKKIAESGFSEHSPHLCQFGLIFEEPNLTFAFKVQTIIGICSGSLGNNREVEGNRRCNPLIGIVRHVDADTSRCVNASVFTCLRKSDFVCKNLNRFQGWERERVVFAELVVVASDEG
ncbi:Uncharacterised protein [Chlamydia trachomatis]|nr:Uncharacterised protein [Chlamydia trachomatis]